MKLFYSFVLFIVILFASCKNNNPSAPESKPAETPKALQDDKSGYEVSLLSKRSYDDLVEKLYNELLEKNTALNTLEHNIEKIKDNSKDSVASFNGFDTKNDSYYSAATTHLGLIKDSVLKNRIKQLVENSLSKYKTKIAAHKNLLAAIAAKDITLDDLHVVLKLTQTLAMIEQYQTNDLPSVKPLENTSKAYDKLIATTDSLSKK